MKLKVFLEKYKDAFKGRKVLIVVDWQNDFIDGALGTKEAMAIREKVREKIRQYEEAGYLIIFTRDTHFANYLETDEGKHLPVPHCIEGTHGWQIAEGYEVQNAVYVDKLSFGYTGWDEFGFDCDIELIGLCTDICVVSNALILKAMYPHLNIIVDEACCAGVTPETHKAAIATMKMCQIIVREAA